MFSSLLVGIFAKKTIKNLIVMHRNINTYFWRFIDRIAASSIFDGKIHVYLLIIIWREFIFEINISFWRSWKSLFFFKLNVWPWQILAFFSQKKKRQQVEYSNDEINWHLISHCFHFWSWTNCRNLSLTQSSISKYISFPNHSENKISKNNECMFT